MFSYKWDCSIKKVTISVLQVFSQLYVIYFFILILLAVNNRFADSFNSSITPCKYIVHILAKKDVYI